MWINKRLVKTRQNHWNQKTKLSHTQFLTLLMKKINEELRKIVCWGNVYLRSLRRPFLAAVCGGCCWCWLGGGIWYWQIMEETQWWDFCRFCKSVLAIFCLVFGISDEISWILCGLWFGLWIWRCRCETERLRRKSRNFLDLYSYCLVIQVTLWGNESRTSRTKEKREVLV